MKIHESHIPRTLASAGHPGVPPTNGRILELTKPYIVVFKGEDEVYEFDTQDEARSFLTVTVFKREPIEIEYGDKG